MRGKILITGGGTGGHVYPALAIIQHLSPSIVAGASPPASADREAIYVGSTRGLERSLVPRTGIRCYFLAMAPPQSLRGLTLLTLATLRVLVILIRERPNAVFATGGYVSVPAAAAAWLLRIPLVLFLPDVVPGKAIRALLPIARRIAVTSAASLHYLTASKAVVTGYPVRPCFGSASRDIARVRFGIPADAMTLLVMGGSRGARSINRAATQVLPDLLAHYHVIHVAGEERLAETRSATANLPESLRARYHLFPYLHDEAMADALAAADLAVTRSGASIIGELPAAGTPAILVPLPERSVHQRENAAVLAEAGAAVVVEDADLAAALPGLLAALLSDPLGLRQMAAAARSLARPDAAAAIAEVIREAA